MRLITSMEVIDWPPRKLAFGDDSPDELAQTIKGVAGTGPARLSIWRRIMSRFIAV